MVIICILHVGVTVLRTLSAIPFFPSDNFFYYFLLKFRSIICTIFLCNKKCRSPCSFKRKGPSHLFNYTSAGYREFALRERCVFALIMISTLSLSFLSISLSQISSSSSQPCLSKTPIFLACKERQAREAAIIFCCQLRVIMRSTGCAVQYWGITLTILFTPIATYWVPDLLNIKGISGHPYLQLVADIHDPTSIQIC